MSSSSRYGSPEEYRKRKVALISGMFYTLDSVPHLLSLLLVYRSSCLSVWYAGRRGQSGRE